MRTVRMIEAEADKILNSYKAHINNCESCTHVPTSEEDEITCQEAQWYLRYHDNLKSEAEAAEKQFQAELKMRCDVTEKDVTQFFANTGYSFGAYTNSVVKSMLLDFAKMQIEKHYIKPKIRVRFKPKDTTETVDGTVIEETHSKYYVVPDDNINGTANWNKRCCELINSLE